MERPIDSRLLLYVVTIADEGNITRAATSRLFVSPGSLARDIRNLEKRIGYPLFVRRWGGVTLTPGGMAFVEEARRSLEHAQRAADRGAAASRGETGLLRVGFTPFLDNRRLAEIRQKFSQAMPEIELDFRSAYCAAQIEFVLREALDAGLIILPASSEEVSSQVLWQTNLVLAIPEQMVRDTPGPLSLTALSGQPAVWLAREVNPALYDRLLSLCHNAGCLPNIVRRVLTYDEMLDAISGGIGVGFVKESTAHRIQVKGIAFREPKDARVMIEFGVIYRPDNSSRSLRVFLQILANMADSNAESSSDLQPG